MGFADNFQTMLITIAVVIKIFLNVVKNSKDLV